MRNLFEDDPKEVAAYMFRRTRFEKVYSESRRMKRAEKEICESHVRNEDYPATRRIREQHGMAFAYGGRQRPPTRRELTEAKKRQMNKASDTSGSPLKRGLKFIYDNFVPSWNSLGDNTAAGLPSPRTPSRSTRKSYAAPGAFPGMTLDSDMEDTHSEPGGFDEDIIMDNGTADDDSPCPSSSGSGSGAGLRSTSDTRHSSTSSSNDDPFSRDYTPSMPTFAERVMNSRGKKRAYPDGLYAHSTDTVDSPSTPRSARQTGLCGNVPSSRYSTLETDAVGVSGVNGTAYSPPSTPYSTPRFGSSANSTPSSSSGPSTSFASTPSSTRSATSWNSSGTKKSRLTSDFPDTDSSTSTGPYRQPGFFKRFARREKRHIYHGRAKTTSMRRDSPPSTQQSVPNFDSSPGTPSSFSGSSSFDPFSFPKRQSSTQEQAPSRPTPMNPELTDKQRAYLTTIRRVNAGVEGMLKKWEDEWEIEKKSREQERARKHEEEKKSLQEEIERVRKRGESLRSANLKMVNETELAGLQRRLKQLEEIRRSNEESDKVEEARLRKRIRELRESLIPEPVFEDQETKERREQEQRERRERREQWEREQRERRERLERQEREEREQGERWERVRRERLEKIGYLRARWFKENRELEEEEERKRKEKEEASRDRPDIDGRKGEPVSIPNENENSDRPHPRTQLHFEEPPVAQNHKPAVSTPAPKSNPHGKKKTSRSPSEYFQWYEAEWTIINSSKSPSPLDFSNIPWPIFPFPKSGEEVTETGIRTFMEETHAKGGLGLRAAAKRELLNWHPDKFATRALQRFTNDLEREAVRQVADKVQKTLTDLIRSAGGSASK